MGRRKIYLTEEDRRRHQRERRLELYASFTEEELKRRKELARERKARDTGAGCERAPAAATARSRRGSRGARAKGTVPFVHGSSGLHERKQSPGVSAVHDSQLDGQEGPASGSSDLSLDSAYFVSTGPEGDSGRRAEVAVDRTILPRNVSKPVTIEVSANPLYTCAFCLTAFGHLRDLAGHVEACPWPEPYLCGLCSEPCKDWKTTRAHMSAHVGKRLACPFCQRKIYKLKYDLVHRHIMLHVTVRQFMCSLCRSAFPSKEGLRSHHSMSRSKGLSCRHTKRRPRKGNASCPRPTVSTHR
ncbi:zinc finger protein 133 isoform X5 [Rhipicephalus sanguineus]|uniref:zinc finger protein 133 isoform X5 n=1 Tax=Rhipicephalus sanguineus TaxID=34632 RepID=UPI0020C4764A|nr:zinc finger protein 133 isoform X5 [Rhipicephalus sanguineus]